MNNHRRNPIYRYSVMSARTYAKKERDSTVPNAPTMMSAKIASSELN